MAERNFTAEVKERQRGEPCFVMISLHNDIGLGSKALMFDFPKGTDIYAAQRLASSLNESGCKICVVQTRPS